MYVSIIFVILVIHFKQNLEYLCFDLSVKTVMISLNDSFKINYTIFQKNHTVVCSRLFFNLIIFDIFVEFTSNAQTNRIYENASVEIPPNQDSST